MSIAPQSRVGRAIGSKSSPQQRAGRCGKTTKYYHGQGTILEPIGLEESDQDLKFTYDGLGRRIMVQRGNVGTVYEGKVVTFTTLETRKFVYLGGSVIRELDNSPTPNVLKEYIRGLGLGGGIGGIIYQKKSCDYYYYHYNHKGDVVALTDANGKLAAYYEYDAWGNTMTEAEKTGVDNPYRYSTKEWDEKSGLCYFGARYYCPEIGRRVSGSCLSHCSEKGRRGATVRGVVWLATALKSGSCRSRTPYSPLCGPCDFA